MNQLAIVIINWNSIDLTRITLQSLQQASGEFDVILIDNGSNINELDILSKEFPYIIGFRSNVNLGFTGGNNIGLQFAIDKQYRFVMMLNNDVEVAPNFLTPLLNRINSDSKIGGVQPLIYFHHNKSLIWSAGGKYQNRIGVSKTLGYNLNKGNEIEAKPLDWITGCAFLMRTEFLKKTGLLQEEFFIYHEDVDLSFKIRDAGYQLWLEPQSVIYHIAGMAYKSKQKEREGFVSPKVHFLNARNTVWILKRYTRAIYWPTVFIYHLSYSLAISFYFILRGRFSKLKSWWKGIAEGITYSLK